MDIFIIIVQVSCLLLLALIFVYWLIAPIISAPFHPSSTKDVLEMFDLARLDRKDRFIDLGSGDGRAALAASRVCEYAEGIEHNPFLTIFARFMALISANGKLKFRNTSFWRVNVAKFDVIFVYLLPGQMKQLAGKLEEEAAPGTRVVTNSFSIPGWKPVEVRNSGSKRYFLYELGKHK